MNWTEIVTAIVAVYGAVLSTYTLFVQWKNNKPRVNVAIDMGVLTSPLGSSEPMIFLSASNPGQKAVTLSSEGFIIPNGKQLVIPLPNSDVTFPHELLPEKNCQIWVETKEIVRALKAEGFSRKVKLSR